MIIDVPIQKYTWVKNDFKKQKSGEVDFLLSYIPLATYVL
jgi:hypothetical protein